MDTPATYGRLPARLLKKVRAEFLEAVRAGTAKPVSRA
jgi:hypothetical protein